MYFIIYALITIFGHNVNAKVILLEEKNIKLGGLEQKRGELGSAKLTVLRNKKTPAKVNLEFGILILGLDCEDYTNMNYFRIEKMNQDEPRQRCRSYREKWLQVSDVLQLNFKDARDLADGENEVFNISIKQLRSKSVKIDIEVDIFDSSQYYEVMFNKSYDPSFMLRPKLKFIYQK